MKRRFLVTAILALASSTARAQDPAVTNPDKYIVILENERTRVLEYRDHPGEKTTLHSHPDSVLYALGAFQRRLTFSDGASQIREFKTGDVVFLPAQAHIGENIGKTDTRVLLVEFKEPRRSATKDAASKK